MEKQEEIIQNPALQNLKAQQVKQVFEGAADDMWNFWNKDKLYIRIPGRLDNITNENCDWVLYQFFAEAEGDRGGMSYKYRVACRLLPKDLLKKLFNSTNAEKIVGSVEKQLKSNLIGQLTGKEAVNALTCFKMLFDTGISLSPANRQAIKNQDHTKDKGLMYAMGLLIHNKTLSQETFDVVSSHDRPDHACECLLRLKWLDMLNLQNMATAKNHSKPKGFYQGLNTLLEYKEILSQNGEMQDHIDCIKDFDDPKSAATILVSLCRKDLFNDKNIKKFKELAKYDEKNTIKRLNDLAGSSNLSQQSLDQLFTELSPKSILADFDAKVYLTRAKEREDKRKLFLAIVEYRRATLLGNEKALERLKQLYKDGKMPCDREGNSLKEYFATDKQLVDGLKEKHKLSFTPLCDKLAFIADLLFDKEQGIPEAVEYLEKIKTNLDKILSTVKLGNTQYQLVCAMLGITKDKLDSHLFSAVRGKLPFVASKIAANGASCDYSPLNGTSTLRMACSRFTSLSSLGWITNPFEVDFLEKLAKSGIDVTKEPLDGNISYDMVLYLALDNGAPISQDVLEASVKRPKHFLILLTYCYGRDELTENSNQLVEQHEQSLKEEIETLRNSEYYHDKRLLRHPGFKVLTDKLKVFVVDEQPQQVAVETLSAVTSNPLLDEEDKNAVSIVHFVQSEKAKGLSIKHIYEFFKYNANCDADANETYTSYCTSEELICIINSFNTKVIKDSPLEKLIAVLYLHFADSDRDHGDYHFNNKINEIYPTAQQLMPNLISRFYSDDDLTNYLLPIMLKKDTGDYKGWFTFEPSVNKIVALFLLPNTKATDDMQNAFEIKLVEFIKDKNTFKLMKAELFLKENNTFVHCCRRVIAKVGVAKETPDQAKAVENLLQWCADNNKNSYFQQECSEALERLLTPPRQAEGYLFSKVSSMAKQINLYPKLIELTKDNITKHLKSALAACADGSDLENHAAKVLVCVYLAKKCKLPMDGVKQVIKFADQDLLKYLNEEFEKSAKSLPEELESLISEMRNELMPAGDKNIQGIPKTL